MKFTLQAVQKFLADMFPDENVEVDLGEYASAAQQALALGTDRKSINSVQTADVSTLTPPQVAAQVGQKDGPTPVPVPDPTPTPEPPVPAPDPAPGAQAPGVQAETPAAPQAGAQTVSVADMSSAFDTAIGAAISPLAEAMKAMQEAMATITTALGGLATKDEVGLLDAGLKRVTDAVDQMRTPAAMAAAKGLPASPTPQMIALLTQQQAAASQLPNVAKPAGIPETSSLKF